MSRVTALLSVCIALLAGGLLYLAVRPMPQALTADQVRAIVAETVAAQPAPEQPAPVAAPALDPATLDPMIESYLLKNPSILQKVSQALEQEARTAQVQKTKATLKDLHQEIYEDPDQVVLGNPQGDVTLVEMFDYNCGYCRGALPDLATLLAEDKNLKVILKEFPILSQGSVDAAKVAVLVNRDKAVDYWAFHQKLFTSRGQVNSETALKAAADLGMDRMTLALDSQNKDVGAVLQKSYDIAKALEVSGTPTYIIGNEVIPGAIGLDQLKSRIANLRACGDTICPPADEG